MKSEKEINSYLKNLRAAASEGKKIENYLYQKGVKIKVKVRGASKPLITFKEFEEWYNRKLPVPNDIIHCKGVLGIVKEIRYNEIILGVSYSNGELSTKEKSIPFCNYRDATEKEILILQQVLSKNRLRWSQFCRSLSGNLQFKENDQIRITRLGRVLGHGVFKEINEKGDLIFYCVKMIDEPVRFSLNETIGPEKDFQLESITAKERELFAKYLSELQRSWNGHQGCIEPLNERARYGETYYYIDDFNKIVGAIEYNKPKDLKRWRGLNYYTDKGEAEEVLAFVMDKRKRQFTNKEKPAKAK